MMLKTVREPFCFTEPRDVGCSVKSLAGQVGEVAVAIPLEHDFASLQLLRRRQLDWIVARTVHLFHLLWLTYGPKSAVGLPGV